MNQSAFVALQDHASDSPGQNNPVSASADLDRVTRSINAMQAATYHWNIATDTITWHGNTGTVFSQVEPESYTTGRAYASLLDPDNFTSRFETVMRNKKHDSGQGVPFAIEYSIKPFGRDDERSIWIEDSGRWFAGPDGHPQEVFGVVRQIDDRHRQDQHLHFLGNCDPLTGMMNRGRLAEALGETIEIAKTESHHSGFLIVSISNLAIVNEAYGFDIADDVIAKIGRRLRKVVRTGDVIGRCSGSKFGIIMSRADQEEMDIAGERFLSVARERVIETEMGPVWAMLSIGGVILPNEGADANLTMAHAEEALTEAIKLPTDSLVVYKSSEDIVSERKLNSRCAIEVVHKLKENEFTLAYQPIVNAQTHEIELYEALLRTKDEDGNLVSAGHLIPVSEKLGLVRLIDQLVVRKVLAALRQFPTAKIAVNISGVTANDPRWFGKITEILEENTEVTDRLTVEITETVALDDIDQTVLFIQKLRSLGCKVAIDDFGAGFTSFQNLKVLNVDKVKIDGSFVENLTDSKDNQFFVHTLIELSKKFDLEVVAEWVETEQDAQLLASWNVDYLQGRLFGMAESESPWGEPVSDDEVCIVPSEIFLEETEKDDSVDVGELSIEPVVGKEPEPQTNDDIANDVFIAIQKSIEIETETHSTQLEDIPAFPAVAEPFEVIIPEKTETIELQKIPKLEIEVSDTKQPTVTPERLIAMSQETADDTPVADVSPLEAEMQKLREAIDAIR